MLVVVAAAAATTATKESCCLRWNLAHSKRNMEWLAAVPAEWSLLSNWSCFVSFVLVHCLVQAGTIRIVVVVWRS